MTPRQIRARALMLAGPCADCAARIVDVIEAETDVSVHEWEGVWYRLRCHRGGSWSCQDVPRGWMSGSFASLGRAARASSCGYRTAASAVQADQPVLCDAHAREVTLMHPTYEDGDDLREWRNATHRSYTREVAR